MKKILVISLFFLGLIIPNIDVKAVDVSNEEQLRAAIEQGGDVILTEDIVVTQPIVIDKDVNIKGYDYPYRIMINGDNTLMTINGGNVTLDNVMLYAGCNGEYNDWGNPKDDVVKGQGTALEINGGIVNFAGVTIYAGNIGVEVNSGTVKCDFADIQAENVGIEVNDGAIVNIYGLTISDSQKAIYLNGGTANLSGYVVLDLSTEGKGIYINKGVNTKTGKEVLSLGKNFAFGYYENTTPNFSIYVNPNIKELRLTDENNVFSYENSKLKMNIQSNDETGPITRDSIPIFPYYGILYSNELGKCTAVYINGVKENELDASCNPVTDNKTEPSQVVNVPATSAYASIIIITLGILCVVVSVIVTRRVTKKRS